MSTLQSQIENIIGAQNVVNDGGVLRVSPATTEEVSAVMKAAHEVGAVVMPTGGGTKLGWGNAVAPQVVLSMARMHSILEHTWQDLTVRVQAGCTWAAMQEAIAQHGQMVALDPLWAAKATVGGIAAVNDSGALRLRYGSLRDLVIGMTIVLADGTIARSGGKVVKNVAGYDMHKLMTGAYGTLGVITEVNFRLHPVEQHAESWSVAGSASALGALMVRVMDSTMQVSALQVTHIGMGRDSRLDVRFAGHPDCLESQQQQMRAMAGGLAVNAAEGTVWAAREKLFDRAVQRDAMVIKATLLPSQVAMVSNALAESGMETQSVIQASGIMTAALYGAKAVGDALIAKLRNELRAKGGAVTVLQRTRETIDADAWGGIGPVLMLMQRVKQELDAARIMNRGRFADGI